MPVWYMCVNTVDWEIFIVKIFASITSMTKIKQAKHFLRRIIRVSLFTRVRTCQRVECPVLVFEKMALLRYLKRVDGLPDPKGPLT